MAKVSIRPYCDNDSANKAIAVQIGTLTLYFSYQTIVAFSSPKGGLVVSMNYWSQTTGKHLNAISTDKKTRVDCEEFSKRLEETLKEHSLD